MSGPGIDYGMGLSNIDEETGIRYGIISQHSVCPEAMDDVYNNGTDLAWEGDKEELTKQLSAALYEVLEDRVCRGIGGRYRG
jgi:hypothetical protein